ncbi:MAG: YabP/YqfC family sporulation protein [Clostridia bacterium]|nr:YabP/YqfC family sporulation protein [Clostridia bacterium]
MERRNGRRWIADRMVRNDIAVLNGERQATVYGCRRILRYEPTRICLERVHGRICVWGEGLICTAFSAGCVTVEGEIGGVRYCRGACGTCREGRSL